MDESQMKKAAQEVLDVLIQNNLSPKQADDVLNYVGASIWDVAIIPSSAKVPVRLP